jgi:putative heme iron utilization protein
MTNTSAEISAAALCRRLIRAAGRATLATVADRGKGGVGGPWPYASLVLVACGHDASPLLLISDLADHTRNLRADPRVSLLYDGTAGLDDPLTGPRVSLQGKAEMIEDPAMAGRYLRRHPHARTYAAFTDFHLVRVHPVRAHLVAGFGRIHWVEADDLAFDPGPTEALRAAEPDLLARINADHPDALASIAPRIRGRRRKGWQATGIDPEGLDMRCGGMLARVDFPDIVTSPKTARKAVAKLAAAARDPS